MKSVNIFIIKVDSIIYDTINHFEYIKNDGCDEILYPSATHVSDWEYFIIGLQKYINDENYNHNYSDDVGDYLFSDIISEDDVQPLKDKIQELCDTKIDFYAEYVMVEMIERD